MQNRGKSPEFRDIIKLPKISDGLNHLNSLLIESGLEEVVEINNRRIEESSGNLHVEMTIHADSPEQARLISSLLTLKAFPEAKDARKGTKFTVLSSEGSQIVLEAEVESSAAKKSKPITNKQSGRGDEGKRGR